MSAVPVIQSAPKPAATRTAPPTTSTGVPVDPVRVSMAVISLATTEVTHTWDPSTARPEGPDGTPTLRTTCSVRASTSTTWSSTMSATQRSRPCSTIAVGRPARCTEPSTRPLPGSKRSRRSRRSSVT